eukprot:g661.t1
MLSSIDLSIFDPLKVKDLLQKRRAEEEELWRLCFKDGRGLEIHYCSARKELKVDNLTEDEYDLNPGWNEMQASLAAVFREAPWTLRRGLHVRKEESAAGAAAFSLYIGESGTIQSCAKIPAKCCVTYGLLDPKSAVDLSRVGDLQSIKQVAVLPLGDRCSVRMLLHKIEFDGPCYPFDLTRTTSLADVADMAATGKRYTGRSARFDWACKNADSVLFVRTGVASRAEVCDLLSRMEERFPELVANLLLISEQETSEFSGLEKVTHVRESFDPDRTARGILYASSKQKHPALERNNRRMYEDMNYWINCAHRFRGILERVGISARNLYWCPNDLKEAEKDRFMMSFCMLRNAPKCSARQERKAFETKDDEKETKEKKEKKEKKESQESEGGYTPNTPMTSTSEIAKFSHANLYELHQVQQAQVCLEAPISREPRLEASSSVLPVVLPEAPPMAPPVA